MGKIYLPIYEDSEAFDSSETFQAPSSSMLRGQPAFQDESVDLGLSHL